ncbi:hypothetical protein BDN67DRAFT_1016189 [Paxillus ammoniavirescens]|nr:hypothetical protein BDN67DRAFT_1016189 [Paxillus ammoniavirescens]
MKALSLRRRSSETSSLLANPPTSFKQCMLTPRSSIPTPSPFNDLCVFVSVQSPESRKRFFANWLLLHPLWFSRILADPSMVAPSPKIWWGFINSKPSANASVSSSTARTTAVQSSVASFFGRLLPKLGDASTWAGDNTVTFQNQVIAISTLANPPPEVAQPILWGLSELSFCFELLALDKNLVLQVWQDAPLE